MNDIVKWAMLDRPKHLRVYSRPQVRSKSVREIKGHPTEPLLPLVNMKAGTGEI